MKKLIFSFIAITVMTLAACGGEHQHDQSNGSSEEAKAHGTGKEYTSAFICPMHCPGSGSDQAGTCPACGMDYMAQADHVKDGHQH